MTYQRPQLIDALNRTSELQALVPIPSQSGIVIIHHGPAKARNDLPDVQNAISELVMLQAPSPSCGGTVIVHNNHNQEEG